MNFTREPIIETIISPKEGCKLLVRSSKSSNGAEEYYVDAVEVVSFGHAFFFRSTERSKAFLVPVTDYEVIQVKEARIALKNASYERNIKIGGGRDAPPRHKEIPQEQPMIAEEEESVIIEETSSEPIPGPRLDKRRDRRRRRHRRSEDGPMNERPLIKEENFTTEEKKLEGGGTMEDETKVSSSMFSSLIPPPPTLISETLSRYKDKEFMEPPKKVEGDKRDKPKEEDLPEDEDPPATGSTPLHRVVSEYVEVHNFSTTSFSPLQGNNDPYSF